MVNETDANDSGAERFWHGRDSSKSMKSGDFDYPEYPFVPPPELESGKPGRHTVVIIGGGLAGLTAAADLGRRGIPCVVLDDNNTVSSGSRSIGQGKRSLEIWDRIGRGDVMYEAGNPWTKGNILRGDELLFAFSIAVPGKYKFPAFLTLPQYRIESILHDHCRDEFPHVEIRWLNRVSGISRTEDVVHIEVDTPQGGYSIDADWVIAADGVRSSVRDLLGVPFEGDGFTDNFVIADVWVDHKFPPQRMFWFEPRFIDSPISLLHQQKEGIWRIDWQLRPGADPAAEAAPVNANAKLKKMFGDIKFDIQDVSVYAFDVKRVPKFRNGRVFFAGDAAHQLSPFGGGRGGNSGVQDVDNLVWKLAMVLNGQAPESLLDTYDDERVPVADENMLLSHRSTEFISPTTEPSMALREAVLRLASAAPFARAFINTGRLSVAATLRESPLVTPDTDSFETHLAPGDAPGDAPVVTSSGEDDWFVRHLEGEFTLMLYAERAADVSADAVAIFADLAGGNVPVRAIVATAEPGGSVEGAVVLSDKIGQLKSFYDLTPGACYLFRPDQHISARWRTLTKVRVRTAVERATAQRVPETVK
jgi:3-(3-hydroxy-phenyl)propionate hydroxylase